MNIESILAEADPDLAGVAGGRPPAGTRSTSPKAATGPGQGRVRQPRSSRDAHNQVVYQIMG